MRLPVIGFWRLSIICRRLVTRRYQRYKSRRISCCSRFRMKALILLAVVAAYVYASCPIANYTRAYIYAKGQAKVEVNSTQVTKGLRIELVSNCEFKKRSE